MLPWPIYALDLQIMTKMIDKLPSIRRTIQLPLHMLEINGGELISQTTRLI